MIHAVRAVGLAAAGRNCALYGPYLFHLARPLWLRLGVARWCYLRCAESAKNGPALTYVNRLTQRLPQCRQAAILASAADSGRVREWEPWPLDPPFADRIPLNWPFQDRPCIDLAPSCVIEDEIPDPPPQIILWREAGGLLDMWA